MVLQNKENKGKDRLLLLQLSIIYDNLEFLRLSLDTALQKTHLVYSQGFSSVSVSASAR